MVSAAFNGIVEIEVTHSDGRVDREVHNNMLVQPGYFAYTLAPFDSNNGGITPMIGIKEIVFGSGSTPPVVYQPLSAMTPIIFKPLISWSNANGQIQTSNLGNLYVAFAAKFELDYSEANGTTIRELGLVFHEHSASLIKTLFARIVRAPIVKTNTIKLTVKWYICMPNPATAPVPVVTFLPPTILP